MSHFDYSKSQCNVTDVTGSRPEEKKTSEIGFNIES